MTSNPSFSPGRTTGSFTRANLFQIRIQRLLRAVNGRVRPGGAIPSPCAGSPRSHADRDQDPAGIATGSTDRLNRPASPDLWPARTSTMTHPCPRRRRPGATVRPSAGISQCRGALTGRLRPRQGGLAALGRPTSGLPAVPRTDRPAAPDNISEIKSRRLIKVSCRPGPPSWPLAWRFHPKPRNSRPGPKVCCIRPPPAWPNQT